MQHAPNMRFFTSATSHTCYEVERSLGNSCVTLRNRCLTGEEDACEILLISLIISNLIQFLVKSVKNSCCLAVKLCPVFNIGFLFHLSGMILIGGICSCRCSGLDWSRTTRYLGWLGVGTRCSLHQCPGRDECWQCVSPLKLYVPRRYTIKSVGEDWMCRGEFCTQFCIPFLSYLCRVNYRIWWCFCDQ